MRALFATATEVAAVLAVLWLAWVYVRGGTGTALAGLQNANRELVRQVRDLQARVDSLEIENAELRGRTDVAGVIAPVIEAVQLHERSAARRSDAMLRVLGMIAGELGTEHDG